MKHTKALATFSAQLRYEALPPSIITAAKRALLDFTGVAAFGTTTEWAESGRQYVRRFGSSGSSVVIGANTKAAARDAALLNGLFAHGFELDDTHVPSSGHPGCAVIPAILAAADVEGCTGRQFLTALIAGYEVMGRIGAAVAPDHMGQGFHATATTGVFGAAVGAALILDLEEEQILAALGISGSFCSGLTEFANDQWGDILKRLHAGKAAENGLQAAQLAATGYRGPRSVLEGRQGFLKTFADKADENLLSDGLGKHFEVETNISFKPYACCSNIFSVVDAVKYFIEKQNLRADSVADVTVFGNSDQVQYHAENSGISTVCAAQYSVPYVVAVTLADLVDKPSDGFSLETIQDPRIIALCKKTTVKLDPEIDALFPKYEAARVLVRLKDGSTLERTVKHATGSPDKPLTQSDLERKFKSLASVAFSPSTIEQVHERIVSLDKIEDMREFTNLLRKDDATPRSVAQTEVRATV